MGEEERSTVRASDELARSTSEDWVRRSRDSSRKKGRRERSEQLKDHASIGAALSLVRKACVARIVGGSRRKLRRHYGGRLTQEPNEEDKWGVRGLAAREKERGTRMGMFESCESAKGDGEKEEAATTSS